MDPERELARLIGKREPVAGNEHGKMDLARGVITQLTGYQPGFVGVKIDASTTTVACEVLGTYSPSVGDVVEILALGDRAVILGAVGTPGNQPVDANYCISGFIIPWVSGALNWIPFHKKTAQGILTLSKISASLHGGTNCTIDIYQGTTLLSAAGLSGLTVTTTDTSWTPSQIITVGKTANTSRFRPQVTAISGTPDGLNIDFIYTSTA